MVFSDNAASVRAFHGFRWRTCDECGALSSFSSAVTCGALVGRVWRARNNVRTVNILSHAGSVSALNWEVIRAGGSGGAKSFLLNAFTVPAMELTGLAESGNALFNGRGAGLIRTSNAAIRAGLNSGAHEEVSSAFTTGADHGRGAAGLFS